MQNDPRANSESARQSLLLVDPDPLLRWSIETHLHQWFDVVAAADAKDALASLRDTRYDAMILCAELGESIRQMEAEARVRNENVKIVRLTTANDPACTDGSVVYLEKPFRLEALARILDVRSMNSGEGRHVR